MPWHGSPPELALPAPRTDGGVVQVGSSLLYIGGSDGTTAQSTVYVAPTVGVGNFDEWAEGPALPEPRSDASTIAVSGIVYVIGGRDADGAPTTTVFPLVPDPQTGVLDDWQVAEELVLPEGRAGAAGRVDARRHPRSSAARARPARSPRPARPASARTAPWAPGSRKRPLVTPQADGNAAALGDYVVLWGGHDANGPVGAVQRGDIGLEAAEGLPENPDEGKVVQWRTNDSVNLPAARDDAAGWSANGTIYSVGGTDGGAPAARAVLGHPQRRRRRPSSGSTSSRPTCRPASAAARRS